MSEFPLPTNFELLVYLLTFVVGYITLAYAYDKVGRLEYWYDMSVFDKSIQSFVIGGLVTLFTVFLITARTTIAVPLPDFIGTNVGTILFFDALFIFIIGDIIATQFLSKEPARRQLSR